MKRVLVLATLLMVSCGGNQNENKTATTEVSGAKKVSAQMADGKMLPELNVVMPQNAPRIDVITAEKDPEFVKSKRLIIANEE